ncbi:M3 family metallopeptidase, partial [Staphylococcus aureus]
MVTSNTLLTYLNSENRKIRKNAYEAVINFFSKKEVEAAFLVNLNYLIKNKMANANGFDTYFEEVIENHFISINNPSFFEVSHNVKKIFKKSLDIRRQILGLEKISHFD